MALHVARGAWVGVVAPGAAHPATFLEHRNRVEPRLFQLNRQANPGKPGADDGNAQPRPRPPPARRRHNPVRSIAHYLIQAAPPC